MDSCWGGRNNPSDANSIDDLTARRDAICASGESLADRLNFNLNDLLGDSPAACRNAVNCIQGRQTSLMDLLTGSGFIDAGKLADALDGEDMDDIYNDDGDVAFEICFGKDFDTINATYTECLEQAAAPDCSAPTMYEPRDGPPGCGAELDQGALPICPYGIASQFEDFGPAYPSDSDPGYVLATASIQDLFIPCSEINDRTSADAVGVILFLSPIFRNIEITTEQIKDALPEDLQYAG